MPENRRRKIYSLSLVRLFRCSYLKFVSSNSKTKTSKLAKVLQELRQQQLDHLRKEMAGADTHGQH